MNKGLVIKKEANFYTVVIGDQVHLCTRRANFRKAGYKIKVGDQVRLSHSEDERPVIDECYPRKRELKKPPVANVDQVVIVMSCLQPDFNAILVDRFILLVSYEGFQPVLCISKADLIDQDLEEWLREEYSVFPLHFISMESGQGLPELAKQLAGKVSVLAGASGVGKSSLINALNPGSHLITGEVNQKMGTGKHTTRHVSLHRVGVEGHYGWLADSPGFSNLTLPPVNRAELATFYPEFVPWLGQCAYKDCLHEHEHAEDCAVKGNIDTDSERYFNYLRLLDEVKLMYKARRDSSSKEESLTKRAVGKNSQDEVLKLGTEGRARSRRRQRQLIEQVGSWSELDEEGLEALNPDEWRI